MKFTPEEQDIIRKACSIIGKSSSKKKDKARRANLEKAWLTSGRRALCKTCGEKMNRHDTFRDLERPSFKSDIVRGWKCPKCDAFQLIKRPSRSRIKKSL